MARYRKIDLRITGDEKFQALSRPQPNGQSLFIHLLINRHTTNIPGLACIGEMAMAEELGWPLEAFREAFREVFQQGMAKADWKARLVWVPKAIHYNLPASANVVKSWSGPWNEVPECELKRESYQLLKVCVEALGEGFAKAFREAIREPSAMPCPIQEQEQEQEQYQEQNKLQLQQQSAGGAGENPENLPVEIENAKTPKPPTEKHKDFHRLCFKFYEFRRDFLGDLYFDPWDTKYFTQCKHILGKANGDLAVAERRAGNLALWNRIDPDYWKMTPGNLLAKWADLHDPPQGKKSTAELTEARKEAEREKHREELENG